MDARGRGRERIAGLVPESSAGFGKFKDPACSEATRRCRDAR
jgi:hypothetical protein